MTHKVDVTQALIELSAGDSQALDRVLPAVYDHLHRLAERELRRERVDHTLSPTALVHEAYLKLVQLDRISWEGRAHFFGACAQVMRRILISYARMKKADKRGGAAAEPVPIDDVILAASGVDELWRWMTLARLLAQPAAGGSWNAGSTAGCGADRRSGGSFSRHGKARLDRGPGLAQS
jgi:RNA polymerase sigma factor (TIGR02999 family)